MATRTGAAKAGRRDGFACPRAPIGDRASPARKHFIRLPRRALDIMLNTAPKARDFLFRALTSRLRQTSARPSLAKTILERIAIVPLGPVEPLGETLHWLSNEFSPIARGSDSEEDRWEHRSASSEQKCVYMAHSVRTRRVSMLRTA